VGVEEVDSPIIPLTSGGEVGDGIGVEVRVGIGVGLRVGTGVEVGLYVGTIVGVEYPAHMTISE